ncbi:MAG: alpha-amylase family protein [Paludibacteraceae bacterium]|nr:alpha-amylase family protein [Paludibacteraceae bacterium]
MVIYQIFTRLFGNTQATNRPNGTLAENGCGKFNQITTRALNSIKELGVTHVWFTGIISHASQTGYPQYTIKANHSAIVKGKAGSPYAIRDYYDVDPDLAENISDRMKEFQELITRTHQIGLKAIIDFVPNHVARQYHSTSKPKDTADLGENDRTDWHFSPQNNFYYIPNTPFAPQFPLNGYSENPAKATGNDCFSPSPSVTDWYETVKLNYGVDYRGDGSGHFNPIPDTWFKMRDILLFWADKKVDGFRCDMAEMVPVEFWHWAIPQIKKSFPYIIFIAEVYNPDRYRDYIFQGDFDYLYDKVGRYDTLRNVICNNEPASNITQQWQNVSDIQNHMLNFLENHDEQRIASTFFANDATKGKPAILVSALLSNCPTMIYCGQELGEKGMEEEGFSGLDGRTTIFDYWTVDTIKRWTNNGKFNAKLLTKEELDLRCFYKKVLNIKLSEKAVNEGVMYDLTWMNLKNPNYNTSKYFSWIRKADKETILIIANFDKNTANIKLNIGQHAFDFLHLQESKKLHTTDLLTGKKSVYQLSPNIAFNCLVEGNNGIILKFNNF